MKPSPIAVYNAHPTTRLPRRPISTIVEMVLRGERARWKIVNVVLVDDATLLEMNRSFLGHDYLTDVITFDLDETPLEGEIYISLDRARAQAADRGLRLTHEILRLAAHGALHLTGYADRTIAQRQQMTEREDAYLARAGYPDGR